MERPQISVLAGTNGAGKSSIGGAAFGTYFNPDTAAGRVRAVDPDLTVEEANSLAWHEGRRLLEKAIAEGLDFAFETTLGGNTITALLRRAAERGFEVRIWFAGLASPELHIARVRARVRRGGHDIPDAKIRERYDASRENLIRLLPVLAELKVFDNSAEADPAAGVPPEPVLLLHMIDGRVVTHCELHTVPDWAKPIMAVALREPVRP